MKKYSNIIISGSLNVTGSLFVNGGSVNTYPSGSTSRTQEYLRTRLISLSDSTDTLINWDNVIVDTISSDLVHSEGVFTNQSGRNKTFMVDYQSAVASTTNITELRIYVTLNGTPTTTNRIATQIGTDYGVARGLESLSKVVTMAPNDTLRFYTFATTTTAANWELSSAVFGIAAGDSTRLKITELS